MIDVIFKYPFSDYSNRFKYLNPGGYLIAFNYRCIVTFTESIFKKIDSDSYHALSGYWQPLKSLKKAVVHQIE